MLVRQSELRRTRNRKKEAYKLRLKEEAAAAPKTAVRTTPTAEKPKAAPRKKKVDEVKAEETADA